MPRRNRRVPPEDPYTGFEVECAESFEFFIQHLTPNGIVPVVEPPVEFYESGLAWLKNHYSEIPEKDLLECMSQLLIDFRENMDTLPLRFEIIDVLTSGTRVEMFGDIVQEIIEYFTVFEWACHKTPPGENYLKARRHYFNVYANQNFRDLVDKDFFTLRTAAIILLGSNAEVEPELVRIGLEIIFEDFTENLMPYIDEGHIHKWAKFGFIPHTLEFVYQLNPEELKPIHIDNIADMILMVEIIYTIDPLGTFPFLDKGTIRGLWRLLDKFLHNRRLRTRILQTILKVLERLQDTVETVQVCMKEEPFSILMDQIFFEHGLDPEDDHLPMKTQIENQIKVNAEAKELSITILLTIYNALHDKKEKEDLIKEFMEDIKNATHGYEIRLSDSGYFPKISWLLTHCRKTTTEHMLTWFHDHFLELEEEREELGVHEDAVDEIYDFPERPEDMGVEEDVEDVEEEEELDEDELLVVRGSMERGYLYLS
ncbi:hypothetical protein CAEBREN_12213 [Caenorhabditis brenneri]|uniref:Uncharacterized protein n=1 Tax=Caenorhabditis brenneri TaxID=135651 RepID=G0MN02_CAEBE|nr:hypothetical protein CAEBREN_12213 [Caenorhabditis brenneri]